jgi:Cu/Ag efflux pump CusA
MSRFFIDRPIFAWVVAIIIMMFGLVAITRLPISRYPNIAPPSVQITASYPGASAQTVEDSVTQIIEQNRCRPRTSCSRRCRCCRRSCSSRASPSAKATATF